MKYKIQVNKSKKKANVIDYFKQNKNKINKKTNLKNIININYNNSYFDDDINENNNMTKKIINNNKNSKKKKKLSLILKWDYENPCDK